MATSAAKDGGFGVADWVAGERPLPLFVGLDFDVRSYSVVTLRRRAAEHVLVISDRAEWRLGILATAIATATLAADPRQVQIWVADQQPDGGPIDAVAQATQAAGMLGADVRSCRSASDPSRLIADALSVVAARRAFDGAALAAAPTLLVVLEQPETRPGVVAHRRRARPGRVGRRVSSACCSPTAPRSVCT